MKCRSGAVELRLSIRLCYPVQVEASQPNRGVATGLSAFVEDEHSAVRGPQSCRSRLPALHGRRGDLGNDCPPSSERKTVKSRRPIGRSDATMPDQRIRAFSFLPFGIAMTLDWQVTPGKSFCKPKASPAFATVVAEGEGLLSLVSCLVSHGQVQAAIGSFDSEALTALPVVGAGNPRC